jgi:hypothetical protein
VSISNRRHTLDQIGARMYSKSVVLVLELTTSLHNKINTTFSRAGAPTVPRRGPGRQGGGRCGLKGQDNDIMFLTQAFSAVSY